MLAPARAGLDLLRLRRLPKRAGRRRRPDQGHVPAGRVPGHLQRIGHEAADGAGAVAAGNFGGVNFTENNRPPRGLAFSYCDMLGVP